MSELVRYPQTSLNDSAAAQYAARARDTWMGGIRAIDEGAVKWYSIRI